MNIIPVDGPRMPVSASTASRPFDAASRSYDHSAWRFGSLMKTLLCSASTTTLCSVGYGSDTTRAGATSPPAIFAVFQPGGHESGAPASSSRQPFSRSRASSRASAIGDAGSGQMAPLTVSSPVPRPPTEMSISPAIARTSLRIWVLSEQDLCRELQLPGRRDGPGYAARRREGRLGRRCRREHDAIRRREIRPVEQVEYLEPQLQLTAAAKRADLRILHQRHVGHRVLRTGETVAAGVAERPLRRQDEGGRVEVAIRSAEDDVLEADARLEVRTILAGRVARPDRKSTRLNSSHVAISYAVFCLKK